jgi:oligoendopeptidase F
MAQTSKSSDVSRESIQVEYKWNLEDLFSSDEEWKKRKDEILGHLQSLAELKGTLAKSAEQLNHTLDKYFQLEKETVRLITYATMSSDQDTRQPKQLSMKQEAAQLKTKLSTAAAFIRPEILRIPNKVMKSFFAEVPKLRIYSHFIDDIYRTKEHTLTEREETIIAETGLMEDTPYEIFTILSNADLPYKAVKLSDDSEVRIDQTGYTFYRANPNRNDRIRVFETFFSALKSFERTFGTQLYGQVKRDLFYRNVRRYNSCLESALHRDNIPVGVYHSLIKNVNANLPTLHRYLKLRRRMLKLDELRYYDNYASMVKEVDLQYTYPDARGVIKRALSPLGSSYVSILEEAFSRRWIDVYPTAGKLSGAYSEGDAYDVHPYILLNYNGRYDEVSALAHELGHTAHSHLSNKNQPYVNSNYPIFLAEVASTVNEALLMDYELNHISDKSQRLSLLGNYLEVFRTTLFRQTKFAEFELLIHEAVEKGEALTGEKFSELYLGLLRRYYGHEEGVCIIDNLYGIEWAFIMHFFRNFYVFQYSTSFTAAQAIASKILKGDKRMVERYIDFLKSGNSEYPIPTLQRVGIDMLSSDPFELTMQRMNGIIDDIEKIISG